MEKDLKQIEKYITDSEKLSLEEEKEREIRNAYEEEKSFLESHYKAIDGLYDQAKKELPFQDVGPFTTASDYQDIDALRYMKMKNKPHWDKVEEYKPYHSEPSLYCGHVRFQGKEYFITENKRLKTHEFKYGTHSFFLINVDDKDYRSVVDAWRYASDYKEEVSLARDVKIVGREVKDVYIKKDDNSVIFKEVSDEFFRGVMTKSKMSAGLKSIIRTIEQKQNLIRLIEANKSFVVQGCAGSGKTMVLLHRIKYLRYNFGEQFRANNYRLLVPSEQYKNYIKEICNDFGIPFENIITFVDYYRKILCIKESNQVEDELVFGEDFLNYVYSKDFLLNNYNIVLNWVTSQVKSYVDYCRKELRKSRKDKDILNIIGIINDLQRMEEKNIKFKYVLTLETSYRYLFDYMKSFYILVQKYESKFGKHCVGKDICCLSYEKSLNAILSSIGSYFLRLCYTEIKNRYGVSLHKGYKHYWYLKLFCRYLVGNVGLSKYGYIFVDEAQELNVMELELIRKINKGKNSPVMNVFGDVNQVIGGNGISCWEDWKVNFDKYVLNENFRNSNQIINFCNNVLGSCVTMQQVGIDMDTVDEYGSIKEIDFHSVDKNRVINFVVKNENAVNNLKIILEQLKVVNFEIYTVKDVKGLEFVEIYVVDQEMTVNEKYIAYTRALKKLHVIHFMPKIVENEYLIKQGNDEDFVVDKQSGIVIVEHEYLGIGTVISENDNEVKVRFKSGEYCFTKSSGVLKYI